MPLLQVKDCPMYTYDRLRERAALEHRSISQETLYIIESYLDEHERHKPASKAAPAPRRFSYARDRHDTTDYAARRRKVFAEIEKLPRIPVTADCPSTADILAEARREDAR